MTCCVCNVNQARYTLQDGRRTCALCPIGLKLDSLRDAERRALREWSYIDRTNPIHSMNPDYMTHVDHGHLLKWARQWHDWAHGGKIYPDLARALRLIIGVDISK